MLNFDVLVHFLENESPTSQNNEKKKYILIVKAAFKFLYNEQLMKAQKWKILAHNFITDRQHIIHRILIY